MTTNEQGQLIDAEGTPLAVGDEVIIRARVTGIVGGRGFNVKVTLPGNPPHGITSREHSVNNTEIVRVTPA